MSDDGFDFNSVERIPDWPQAVFALAKALEHYALWLHDFAYAHDDPYDPSTPPPPPALLAAIKRVEAMRADVAVEVKLQDQHKLLNLPVLGHA